jgi:glycosyltransferase involved in cell wall biosynthesis
MPSFVDRILVIDDGSDDATVDVARSTKHCSARTSVLVHARRSGVFAAIATGYRHALAETEGTSDHDAFVVLAGDGQMDPADVERVALPVVRGEVGYVKGNRFAEGAPGMPRARFLGGHLFSGLTRAAIGKGVHDSQCGFTAIARWACATLDLGSIWQSYGYPNDLLATHVRERVPFAEVPVRTVYGAEVSRLRPRDVVVIAGFVLPRAFLRTRARLNR